VLVATDAFAAVKRAAGHVFSLMIVSGSVQQNGFSFLAKIRL
jgi:hypothetical protein